MIKKISLLCLFISSPVLAVVPHTFQAGSPARASEVNENFSAIEEEIKNINTSVSGIEGNISDIEGKLDSIGVDSSWDTSIHAVSYKEAGSNVGDLVTINGEEYRMVSAPFVEFGSGSLYSLIFPLNEQTVAANVTYRHSNNEAGSHDLTISGYPARNKFSSDYRSVFMNRSGVSDSYLSQNYSFLTEIKVNETVLTVQFMLSEKVDSVQLPKGTYDFTAALDSSGFHHDNEKIKAIDKMVDHIKIIRMD